MDGPKKLYRTEGGAAMLCGVCGGIAEYFGIDPSIVRLVWAALVLFGGTGIQEEPDLPRLLTDRSPPAALRPERGFFCPFPV